MSYACVIYFTKQKRPFILYFIAITSINGHFPSWGSSTILNVKWTYQVLYSLLFHTIILKISFCLSLLSWNWFSLNVISITGWHGHSVSVVIVMLCTFARHLNYRNLPYPRKFGKYKLKCFMLFIVYSPIQWLEYTVLASTFLEKHIGCIFFAILTALAEKNWLMCKPAKKILGT